jgi:hypothetical protein
MNPRCFYSIALFMRFSASVMLAHDSPLLFSTLPYPRDSQHLSCWLKNLCHYFYTTLSTRFTASVMLAHESLLQKLTLPYSRDSQHPSCWFMNPCYKTCSSLSTEFPVSVMLALESLLLPSHCPSHDILSICHAGS